MHKTTLPRYDYAISAGLPVFRPHSARMVPPAARVGVIQVIRRMTLSSTVRLVATLLCNAHILDMDLVARIPTLQPSLLARRAGPLAGPAQGVIALGASTLLNRQGTLVPRPAGIGLGMSRYCRKPGWPSGNCYFARYERSTFLCQTEPYHLTQTPIFCMSLRCEKLASPSFPFSSPDTFDFPI